MNPIKPDLLNFVDAVIEFGFEGEGLDPFDIQDLALEYGLLEPREMQEPCDENCRCLIDAGSDEFPLTCYRKTYQKL